jgi:hypothetical protein
MTATVKQVILLGPLLKHFQGSISAGMINICWVKGDTKRKEGKEGWDFVGYEGLSERRKSEDMEVGGFSPIFVVLAVASCRRSERKSRKKKETRVSETVPETHCPQACMPT